MQIMSIGSAGIASVSSLSGGNSPTAGTAQINQAVNNAINGNANMGHNELGISKDEFMMIISLSLGDDDKKHSSTIATLAIEMYLAGNALQAMSDMSGLQGGPSAGGIAGAGGIGGMGGMGGGGAI